MRIGVDLDDVLGEFMPQMLAFHNEVYGTDYDGHTTHHFHALFDLIGKTEEEAIQKMEKFYKSKHFNEMKPVHGAKDGLKKIKASGHRVAVITGRPHHIKEKTEKWLEEHFGELIDEVHFADHSVNPHGWNKGEMCKRLGIHHHIDDFLFFAQECAEHGINVLLLDRPWNRVEEDLHHKITRVFSWEEITIQLT